MFRKFFRPLKFIRQFKEACMFPLEFQEKLLLKILKENRKTLYGKKFGFSKIKSIEDFQKKVPIITYPDIKDYIEKMKCGEKNILVRDKVLFFATSSGTTGDSKFIPITKKRMEFSRGEFLLWIKYMFMNYPKIIMGKTLYFAAGHLNGYTKAKIPHGNISGYLLKNSSRFIKRKFVIDSEILNLKDFDERMKQISVLSLLERKISQIAFASSIEAILFFDYLLDHKSELINLVRKKSKKRARFLEGLEEFKPAFIWPKLWVINCIKSGSNISYLEIVKEKLGKDVHVMDPGILASEGRISLGITELDRAGVIPANETFFEFSEKKEDLFLEPVTLDKLELGKQYKVIMTTFEGLYRYDIEDIIEVVKFVGKVPLVRFVSRNRFLNVTEEHSPEMEIIHGVEKAMKYFGVKFRSFTVIPYVLHRKPKYEILIEPFEEISEELGGRLLKEIDSNWQASILTYAKTRNEFGRMDPPILSIVEKGNYDRVDAEILVVRAQAKPVNVTEDVSYKEKFVIEKTFKIKEIVVKS